MIGLSVFLDVKGILDYLFENLLANIRRLV